MSTTTLKSNASETSVQPATPPSPEKPPAATPTGATVLLRILLLFLGVPAAVLLLLKLFLQ
jgi:hypothetical protein